MLLSFLFIIVAVNGPSLAQRSSCSRDRMRQCSDSLLRSIQRRVNDMNRGEMSAHCVNVRDDFNCLLRETRCLTTEIERNRNGDTLRNALKYIRDGCDTNGASWRDSSCYVGDGMKTCESSYPLGGVQYSSYNPETCRKFNLFQDCVMETIRNRCRPDDDRLLGQYLVDSGSDLAWNCGESTSTSDWDRKDDRNDRYGDRDRDRGGRGDYDRDRTGSDWRAGSRDRGYPRDGDRDRDRYSDRYDRNNGGYDRGYGGSSDISCCRNERCSTSRMQQCKDSLSRTIDSRLSGYQDLQKCRQTRDDFNCLLWQTSNCQNRNDRDRDNDIFRRAQDYISRNCNSYGRWSENSCYKSTEMQRCEASLTNTRGGANYESCRTYNTFRDCMQDELQRRCTRDDELYQGAYLVDKAQELAWQCGSDQYNGRNQYFTNDNRRDQYGSRDSDSYSGYDSPNHLDDEDAMCLSRIQTYSDQCKTTLDDKRRDLYITTEYEARQRITCCSARAYRSCLYDATKRICQGEHNRVVESLMGRYGYELTSDNCRNIYDCSSGYSFHISFLLLACIIVIPQFFTYHLL